MPQDDRHLAELLSSPRAGSPEAVGEALEAQREFRRFDGASEKELLAWLRRVLLNNVANFACAYRETEKRNVGREVELEAGRSSADWRGGLIGETLTPSGYVMKEEQTDALEAAIQRLLKDCR